MPRLPPSFHALIVAAGLPVAACAVTGASIPAGGGPVSSTIAAVDTPEHDLAARSISRFPFMDTHWFRVWIADNDDKAQRWPIGYNGLAALVPHHSGANIFVPYFSGLNYETIDLAGLSPYPRKFEPRREPMSIVRAGAREVVLRQPETGHAHVSATITFRVEEPWYVHQTIELVFHKRFVADGEAQKFASLFASYMFLPDDPLLYVRPGGVDEGQALAGWFGVGKAAHDSPTYTMKPLPADRELPVAEHAALMARSESTGQFDGASSGDPRLNGPLVVYYGHLYDGLVFIQMFKQPERFRFAYSPSGGSQANRGDGEGVVMNPAWDYRIVLDDVEIGKTYRFDTCIAVKPYRGRADVIAEAKKYLRLPRLSPQ